MAEFEFNKKKQESPKENPNKENRDPIQMAIDNRSKFTTDFCGEKRPQSSNKEFCRKSCEKEKMKISIPLSSLNLETLNFLKTRKS